MNAKELVELAARLDRENPIRPQNRGKARLHLSYFLARGSVVRIFSDVSREYGDRPLILMHPDDARAAAEHLHPLSRPRWEQELADVAEELFARQREQDITPGVRERMLDSYREAGKHLRTNHRISET